MSNNKGFKLLYVKRRDAVSNKFQMLTIQIYMLAAWILVLSYGMKIRMLFHECHYLKINKLLKWRDNKLYTALNMKHP